MEITKSNDPLVRHLFDRDPSFNVYNNEFLNLAAGTVGPDLFKVCGDMIARASQHRWEEEKREEKYYLFQYGMSNGLWECREELAQFLTRKYGDPVERENLVLSCGAAHGLILILNNIISPDGVIFVEDLTYMDALELFKQFPLLKIVPVPLKNDSVDLDALEKLAATEKKRSCILNKDKIFWAMFYSIPTFHNPTGISLKPDACQRLVKIARIYSFVVVCDDVYNLLNYEEGFPPHRLFFFDNPKDEDFKGGNVISNGSFSKIFFPAVRVGWMECSPKIVDIFKNSGIMNCGGAANHFMSGTIASFLHLGLADEYLDVAKESFKNKLSEICNILDQFLPRGCSYKRPKGGYYIWLELPKEMDGFKFIEWSKENYKVTAIPGAQFSYSKSFKNFLRLCFTFHSIETLRRAARTLCEGLEDYVTHFSEKKT